MTIFGYQWEDIQRAQQGGRLARAITPHAASKPESSQDDLALLKEHGEGGLREMGFYGVLDRLARSGAISA